MAISQPRQALRRFRFLIRSFRICIRLADLLVRALAAKVERILLMSDFWVFGYGSLMWRPGFDFVEQAPARLDGLHRALCVYSWVHRGTRENPGLVLGLDRGGSCRGVAYRVAGRNREAVLAYLRERELVTGVYREVWWTIRFTEAITRPPVKALTYLAERDHVQYAGRLPRQTLLAMISGSSGQSGANRDYVINTAAHLKALGLHDPVLDWLSAELQKPAD
jgi:cation transport protein ChaC